MNPRIQQAQTQVARADFTGLLGLSQQLGSDPAVAADDLFDLGALLSAYGFLTDARSCYDRAKN